LLSGFFSRFPTPQPLQADDIVLSSLNLSNAMSVNATHVPKISLQRPSVDFIDNQLPQIHPAFSHPGVEYDPSSEKYVPVCAEEAMSTSPRQLIPPRTTLPEVEAMKFWSHIFPDSMEKLKSDFEEPKERCHSEYSIRVEKDWDSVRLQLLKAKERYGESKEGISAKPKKIIFQRFLKGAYRKVADSSENLKAITRIGEKIEYVSPVLAVVDILLDVGVGGLDPRPQFCFKDMSNCKTGGHDGIKSPQASHGSI
jgi:hypothetical protein